MDQETDKIKQHIDTEREQLGRNLDEIEYRVKRATDLKGHFDKNTGWILGAAVAGSAATTNATSTPIDCRCNMLCSSVTPYAVEDERPVRTR